MPFLFSPSALLTLDVTVEEADSAPMDDGALPMPPLYVARPPAHLDLRRDGLPLSLQRFPGHKALDFFFAYDMFHFWGDVCYCDSPWYRGKLAYRVYPVYGRADIAAVLGDCIQDWAPGDDGLYPTSPRWLVTRWLALLSPFDMGESE